MAQFGRVLKFDGARGYGFIAPDDGGADVFVHGNEIEGDESRFLPGARVEFEVIEGERGKKAITARVVADGRRDRSTALTLSAASAAFGAATRAATVTTAATTAAATTTASAPVTGRFAAPGDDDGMCDVLTSAELRVELTEMFLGGPPDLTVAQMLRLHQDFLLLARTHGWVEG